MPRPPGAPSAPEAGGTGVPERGSVILASLIIVAAVANLNLSVANVALPSIGLAFDASQTAVGPGGRRLLARARRVRPLARGHRRPVRPEDAVAARHRPVDPRMPRRRVRTVDRGADRGPHHRRRLCRHGLPHHARPDHGPLGSRARPDALDRALVGPRRRHRRAGPPRVRVPARAVRVGIGLPRDAAAGRGRAVHGLAERAGARQRDRRSRRQPRRHPVGSPGRNR